MEKLLPHNIEAECGVLGSIIIDPEAITQVADFLRAEDFYRDAHRTIYAAIMSLYHGHEPADYITLCDTLEREKKLNDVGGGSYITGLINQVPTSGNIEYYGRIVERTAIRRRLIHGAGQIAAIAYEEGDADIALDKAEKLIFDIRRSGDDAAVVSFGDVSLEFADWFERIPEGGAIVGVPSGLSELDKRDGGFQKANLTVLVGRPGAGKTSMALSIALAASKTYQRGVLFFSAEMSRLEIYQRAVAHEARVNLHRLRMGWLSHQERDRVSVEAVELANIPLYIDDTPAIDIRQMKSRIRRELQKHDVDLIIVDHIQRLKATDEGGKRYSDSYKETSEIVRELKCIAREFNLPVLALAQLSRAVEGRQSKIPQLSDIRESGRIEEEADVVLGLYRDEYYNKNTARPGVADIYVLKNRNGPDDDFAVGFEGEQTRFYNLVPPEPVIDSSIVPYAEEVDD